MLRAAASTALILAGLLCPGCAQPPAKLATPAVELPDPDRDYHSYANTGDFRTEHLLLDLEVDFDLRQLRGTAELRLHRLSPAANHLVLDTRDLSIDAVEAAAGEGAWAATPFTLGVRDAILGSPLRITLPAAATRVRVHYATAPDASGLQWLTPEQTAGKKHPFLYTQSQAIHARSWVPLQDTPLVRTTYEAHIRTPKNLLAVMSASNRPDAKRDGDYRFRMPQPVPSYLLALAVGDLRFRPIGPRTGIYSEPSMERGAAHEFEDTERMIEICEKLFGPYRWDRYDMLVLPPSFPYGGMENPRLTFLTPTAVVGDKSGVSLIAHELAHSWSGNLVTNATWRDFWLNEGTTTYLTYRIMDELYSVARGNMERALGYQDWIESNEQVSRPGDRALAYDVRGRDPDEVFSSIPYQRGEHFLAYLESKFGRPAFDSFLRGWFDGNAFQSRTTEDFIAYLDANLLAANPGVVSEEKIHEWIFGTEMPADLVRAESDAFTKVDSQRDAWLAGTISVAGLKTARWSAHEWQHFLDNLPDTTTPAQVAALDRRFHLNREPNAYIATAWFRQAIRFGYEPALAPVEKFLLTVGRMRFINPLYRELAKTPEGLARAKSIYQRAKPGYHPIARAAVERLLVPSVAN